MICCISDEGEIVLLLTYQLMQPDRHGLVSLRKYLK